MLPCKLLAGYGRRLDFAQRMPYVLGIDAALTIPLLLEGEDHQHLLEIATHQAHAARAPRPKLRGYVVENGNAAAVQFARDLEVKRGRVDQDGSLRLALIHRANQLAELAIYLGQARQDLGDADHGQFL